MPLLGRISFGGTMVLLMIEQSREVVGPCTARIRCRLRGRGVGTSMYDAFQLVSSPDLEPPCLSFGDNVFRAFVIDAPVETGLAIVYMKRIVNRNTC